jgi:hypothetical protein
MTPLEWIGLGFAAAILIAVVVGLWAISHPRD